MQNHNASLRGALFILLVVTLIAGSLVFAFNWPVESVQGSRISQAETKVTEPVSEASRQPEHALAVIALTNGRYTHLYAFDPLQLPVRYWKLTGGPWDDIHPALSPDGSCIAFASHQNGFWDIYSMDLTTGDITRLTDTAAYDGHPSWSPDGRQLVFETLIDESLDIQILNLDDLNEPPVRLTFSANNEHSPQWSPQADQVALISTQAGFNNILLADLTSSELAFQPLVNEYSGRIENLVWSPDGQQLLYSTDTYGSAVIERRGASPDQQPVHVAAGTAIRFDPDGELLLSEVQEPNGSLLAIYHAAGGQLVAPPVLLPGPLRGMDWGRSTVGLDSLSSTFTRFESLRFEPPYNVLLTPPAESTSSRVNLVRLGDVAAPYPFLLDEVDDSFHLLRAATGEVSGWDVLGSLEQAYRPLSAPADPADREDWLQTGRAFAANRLPVSAGWMVLQAERFNGQIYWRVFVRALRQDGSQGEPLRGPVWNLNARNEGDPAAFEYGGRWEQPPPGYWIDLTSLALRFNWHRLPALQNWRTYYPAARFNQWVQTEGQSWDYAIKQLYPPEALQQPTAIPTFNPAGAQQPTVLEQLSTAVFQPDRDPFTTP